MDTRTGNVRILVQVRAESLESVAEKIAGLSGVAVNDRDPRGKLAVAVTGLSNGHVAAVLAQISKFPDVISTTMVYARE